VHNKKTTTFTYGQYMSLNVIFLVCECLEVNNFVVNYSLFISNCPLEINWWRWRKWVP